tara:strand:+ start:2590 stop:3789 length:1200 start_codon:yes stop_codon:yes gene_type:complete
MSEDNFLAGSTSTLSEEFLQRANYKERFLELINDHDLRSMFVDLWYTRPNYGLLNEKFEPVVLLVDDDRSALKPFGGPSDNVFAASFTVNMFNKFRSEYLEKISNSDLQVPRFLNPNLAVQTGYTEFDQAEGSLTLYREYIINYYFFALKDEEFYDFRGFYERYLKLAEENLHKFPITRSGFALSQHCPVTVSGIVVELATLDYSEDSIKQMVVDSVDFHCFAEHCNGYGLMIDKNAPWRLLVDFDSVTFEEQMKLQQSNTAATNTLNHWYRTKTHYDDIFEVKELLSAVYNRIVEDQPFFNNQVRPSAPETLEDEKYWIDVLWKTRTLELQVSDQYEQHRNEILVYHDLYRNTYASNPFKPVSGKIGEICANFIETKHKVHYNINTEEPLYLKDYYSR